MISKFLKTSFLALAAIAVLALAAPPASANSNTYDVTATFSDGQTLSGTAVFNTTTDQVTSYDFTLSGAKGTQTCSGSCNTLIAQWTSGSYNELVYGAIFNPFDTYLGFEVYNNWGYQNITFTQDTWTQIQAPEAPTTIMLLASLALIGFLAFRSPKLRSQN